MAPFTSFRLTAQVELLLLVHDLVVGLDHVVLAAALGAGPRRLGAALLGTGSGRLLLPLPGLVERGTGGRVRRVELVQRLADDIRISGTERLLGALERRVEPALRVRGQAVHPLLAVLLDSVDQAVQLVPL